MADLKHNVIEKETLSTTQARTIDGGDEQEFAHVVRSTKTSSTETTQTQTITDA